MKRLRLYSEDLQEEKIEQNKPAILEGLKEGMEEVSKGLDDLLEEYGGDSLLDILERQTETHQSKIKSEEIDYFSVSRQLKKKLISYYLNNKSRYRIYSNRRGKLSVDDYIRKVYLELGKKLYSLDTKGAAKKIASKRMPPELILNVLGWTVGGLGFATVVMPHLHNIGIMLKESPLGFFEALAIVLGSTVGAGIMARLGVSGILKFIFGKKYKNKLDGMINPINNALAPGKLQELKQNIKAYYQYMDPKPVINQDTEIFLKDISQNRRTYYVKLVYTFERELIGITKEQIMRTPASLGKQINVVMEVGYNEKGESISKIIKSSLSNYWVNEPEDALVLLMPFASKVLVQLSTSSTFDENSVFLEYGFLMYDFVTKEIRITSDDLNEIKDILKEHNLKFDEPDNSESH